MKIYRADEYHNDFGSIVGFYLSKEEAMENIEGTIEVPLHETESHHSQITEFEVEDSVMEGVEITDTKRVLKSDIWGSGEILNDYYFNKH